MASNTRRLKIRRALRVANAGRARKNFVNKHGTTQKNLPLNMPTANELAQKKAAGK